MERSKGYILLARQLLESEIMDWPPLHLKIFLWLLLKANWVDNPKTGIKRGEVFTTVNHMREEMTYRKKKPSYEEVRWFIEKLVNSDMCTTRNTTRGMVIKITNYNKYQLPHTLPHTLPQSKKGVSALNNKPFGNRNKILPQSQPQSQPQTIQKEVILIRNKDIYSRVISHLNSKTGKTYRPSTTKTQRLISARLNDGFSPEDLMTVVDIKSAQWLGTDYEKYLRPETLFGSKCEGYLNEGKTKKPKSRVMSDEEKAAKLA